ncbi:glycerol-3-phosphate acyltransferase [Thiosulfatimonas sediminis]|uniref:Glycerol-3-phosphate acyltransferase n=1 Tax=Thiosulfatimonas sediminis TaxID=2675054 RepID=A0A6F8PXP7_9GAMM|nr:glycerol-3-phosphate 1-O-acyltransferase PlsY [Thiosulfatimonas sediminis]BBP46740.1 glycerol-3-phosphate acyltransferase [Thiosulfatimonas sediminis]
MGIEFSIAVLLAYLLGSVSTAIIVCRLMGLGDPREGGSGNPGATNVKRLYGNKAAAITLFGDLLKGVIPVLAAYQYGFTSTEVFLIGFAAFIGHLYPLFFGFRGGKGVATMLGMMLALSLPIGLAIVATWLFVAKVLKISSLSALVAATLTPVYVYFISADLGWFYGSLALTLILFWRHRSNIQRLLNGEESLIKQSN